jgi:RNA polymerase sigma-70 factor (ECF subfamily)
MSASVTPEPTSREEFNRRLAELRPRLHRYCARMTGSVIDGEDVVQEALLKALEAFAATSAIAHPEGWLFRIAHNAALDFLRRRTRQDALLSDEDPDMMIDPANLAEDRLAASSSLRTFLRLPVAQRSSVILMDVLGYSLEEIGGIIDVSIPAVKAALHRGRARLRELAQEPDDHLLPMLTEPERALLTTYAERFNARDFDAVRDMLAEEVRLELVNKTRARGRAEVGRYFHNYAQIHDWHLAPGFVDGRPALLVGHPASPLARPAYFILLGWQVDRLAAIRDFRYARYAMEDAEVLLLD